MIGDPTGVGRCLREIQQRRLRQVDVLTGSTAPADVVVGDWADQVSSKIDSARTAQVVALLNNSTHDTSRALEKLSEGTYGACDGCGCEIPGERLAVRPEAVLCVKCKIIDEQRPRFKVHRR
ncbi:MAG: TraR/DksA family transcriptional regulator [bacterium]|nr:TraR/DksA family transcriptional regulator [bacterium]